MEEYSKADPISSSHKCISSNPKWISRDTGWMLNLFGCSIGAGILYLPIKASGYGILSLILISLILAPVVLFCHRNLVRFCMSSNDLHANITGVFKQKFGKRTSELLTIVYSLSVYPIAILYAIGITQVLNSFIENQLGVALPIGRGWLNLILILSLSLVVHLGEKSMLRVIKIVCFPLVLVLLSLSIYLIPSWSLSSFYVPIDIKEIGTALFIVTPILLFSFNYSPACSAFSSSYRIFYKNEKVASQKANVVLIRNTQLLIITVFFFVFSCVLSIPHETMLEAKANNLPVLSILANKSGNTVFSILSPIIAFLAIASSWFGVYLATLEGIQGIGLQQWKKYRPNTSVKPKLLKRISIIFVISTCWYASYIQWSVIDVIEVAVIPFLMTILFFIPLYSFYKFDELKNFRRPWQDFFVIFIGIMTFISVYYQRFY